MTGLSKLDDFNAREASEDFLEVAKLGYLSLVSAGIIHKDIVRNNEEFKDAELAVIVGIDNDGIKHTVSSPSPTFIRSVKTIIEFFPDDEIKVRLVTRTGRRGEFYNIEVTE